LRGSTFQRLAPPPPHSRKPKEARTKQRKRGWLRHLCREFGNDDLAVAAPDIRYQDLVRAGVERAATATGTINFRTAITAAAAAIAATTSSTPARAAATTAEAAAQRTPVESRECTAASATGKRIAAGAEKPAAPAPAA
jgi:hypothetical protein